MKYLLIISVALALFNSIVAAEVNEPVGEIKSKEIKQADYQNTENVVAQEDIRVISEKTSDSIDTVIIAFTFLLGALTVMATLFGIFIGYTWWKSSKEYEKEVRRAEDAANRAEVAAREAEGAIGEIRTKGDKAIKDIGGKLRSTIERKLTNSLKHTTETPENLRASLEEAKKPYEVVQETEVKQKLEELRKKAVACLEKNDPKAALRWLRESVALNKDDIRILGSLGLILLGLENFEEALGTISTAIQKNPKYGAAYFWRIQTKLSWQKKGGPNPSKDSIKSDVRMANELGYTPNHQDRTLLADFLTDEEYIQLMGLSKTKDKTLYCERFLIREQFSRIVESAIKKLKNEDLEETLGLLEACTILDENNPNLWVAWALVLGNLKRYEEGLQKMIVAINKNPKDGFSYFARARMNLEWHQNGGVKPNKEEILSDLKEAAKYGHGPEKYEKDDKALLMDFFGKNEYDKLDRKLQ